MDIQSARVEEAEFRAFHADADPDTASMTKVAEPPTSLDEDLASVCAMIEGAKRPLLWLGQGIRLGGAVPLLRELLDCLHVPALVSWSGIDMLDSSHPLVYGRAGVYGQRAANFILQNCDALLTIGTRLALPQVGYDISEFARGAKVMVVDIDRDELAKYAARYERAICCDAKTFLDGLLTRYHNKRHSAPSAWIARCDDYRDRYPWVGPEHVDRDNFINSYPFMEKLNDHLKYDQMIVTDMGTALLSGHQVLRVRPPQRLMTSLGLGEMGYGLPGAIGASFARDRGEVLCLNCDGGMMMNLQELQTIVHHALPIKIIVFNNDGYLMIKHTQKALFSGRYSGTHASSGVTCPDFGAVARAFRIPAFSIRTWDDFDEVMPRVQRVKGPALCEVFIHPEQPLVPKLAVAAGTDGTLVSPPLEDLTPLLRLDELRRNMPVGLHPKSLGLSR
jgi:acetolactate synthase-1/2/3 large subunit